MMLDGDVVSALSESRLLEDYFGSMRQAYKSMGRAVELRKSAYSQDDLAGRLRVNKSIISKRLSGKENLTLKTLSFMATALECKLVVEFLPIEDFPASNYFSPHFRQNSIEQTEPETQNAQSFGGSYLAINQPDLWGKLGGASLE